MRRDFKTGMLFLVFGLPIFLASFIAILYVANCGFSSNCSQVDLPSVIHTPIPTLIPATLPPSASPINASLQNACPVTAKTLLGAWVSSGYSETNSFQFTDVNGTTCEGTFKADVLPLFTAGNLWYSGSMSCAFCHVSDVTKAAAGLDLSSYSGIVAGSQRTSQEVNGTDILGGGNWEKSLLYQKLFVANEMPKDHPASTFPVDGPTILAGHPKP